MNKNITKFIGYLEKEKGLKSNTLASYKRDINIYNEYVSKKGIDYLNIKKEGIKIESGTIGRVIDSGTKNVFHMGAVMAKAAADTIFNHLKDLNREIDYYDLVLSGDLGIYGKNILKEYILKW